MDFYIIFSISLDFPNETQKHIKRQDFLKKNAIKRETEFKLSYWVYFRLI